MEIWHTLGIVLTNVAVIFVSLTIRKMQNQLDAQRQLNAVFSQALKSQKLINEALMNMIEEKK